jgi:hypothetical protein
VANAILAGCGGGAAAGGAGGALLPVSPFYAPRYHFGMLLGVDDFETEQAYHRGKGRLHNAWLHGEGVVWGFRVDLDDERGEISVQPGLALDAAGRELHLDAAACVNVGLWYQAHKDDPEMEAVCQLQPDGTVLLSAHVVARFSVCAARPVPSIAEPCAEGGGSEVACSRAQETVELLLVPGPAPKAYDLYPRLRLLFGLDPAREAAGEQPPAWDPDGARAERARIIALPAADQAAEFLAAFRRFAAMDEMDLAPATTDDGGVTAFPADDETRVLLAEVTSIVLKPGTIDGAMVLDSAVVDNTVRPSHVATRTIQELLCGTRCACDAAAPPPPPEDPGEDEDPGEVDEPGDGDGGGVEGPGEVDEPGDGPSLPPEESLLADTELADAGGPRIDPYLVVLKGERVSLTATLPLSRASVQPDAFSVSAYDLRDGWHDVEIRETRVERNRRTVHLELDTGFGGNLVRVIARGTGPRPLLGTTLLPLAGAAGGPAGTEDDGHDFVIMLKRSET